MEDFDYKLVMFGFSALCEDLEEVQRRLSLYPKERYELENGDEGIMFNYKDDYEPFEFVKIDNSRDYFKEYIADSLVVDIDAGNLTSQGYKTLLFIWFLGTFFPFQVSKIPHCVRQIHEIR